MISRTRWKITARCWRILPIFPPWPGRSATARFIKCLRANLKLTNLDGASDALEKILKQFPASDLAPDSALLYGQGLADASRPAAARAVFQQFLAQFPGSPLRPEVEFAIARAYELEQDWPDAIAGYQGWLEDFPTNDLRPQVRLRAGAGQFPGRKRNECVRTVHQFRRAVSDQPATDAAGAMVAGRLFLRPRRDQLRGRGEKLQTALSKHQLAEYDLAYPARMMAGRAAVARQGYSDAIAIISARWKRTPIVLMDLRVQAAFAHGIALMRMDSTVTNDPLHNFSEATNEFASIIQLNPTNEAAARAWGEIGDCNLQLANYDAATNAYAQVLNTNVQANISLRSQAQVGIGMVLEKKAALASGDDRNRIAQSGPGKLPRCVRFTIRKDSAW